MKKCGVITLHDNVNYGNRLQNYAVMKVLEKIGCVGANCRKSRLFILIGAYVAKVFFKIFGVNNKYARYNRHAKGIIFTHKYIENGATDEVTEKNKYRLDYVLCGSDQIWNPKWAGQPHFFAAMVPPQKRISYAASVGVSEIPKNRKSDYTKYLTEMKAISVREEAGAKIVKELTGRDAELLVDPTLMLEKTEWQKISKKPKFNVPEKYILTYFLGDLSEENEKYIKSICEETGYSIINLNRNTPNKYWYTTGPDEFVYLIEHASIMFTDSFHGTVFSVLMGIPFLVFERVDTLGNMNSRIDTLLNTLQLQNVRFENQRSDEIFKKDYSHIPNILKRERGKAIAFLKNAMELK